MKRQLSLLSALAGWLELSNREVRNEVHRFGLLLCFAAILPFVPQVDVRTFVFLAAFAALIGFWPKIYLDFHGYLGVRSASIVGLVALAVASLTWLLWNGGLAEHWFRAIVPFLFLLVWFWLPRLTEAESRSLARWMIASTVVWALRLLVEALTLALGGSDVFVVRLTTRVTDSVLPFPLVALPLLLFWDAAAPLRIRSLLLVALLVLYVWIGYRGGLLLVGLMLGFWCLLRPVRLIPIAAFLAVAVAAMQLVAPSADVDVSLLEGLTSRFASIEEETEGIRMLEWRYALDRWFESPLVGKGLGWQVPGDVTFFGLDDVDIEKPDTVGYVHSFAAYFLMNLGILGLLLYVGSVAPVAFALRRFKVQALAPAVAFALLLLVAFFLTQASFRQIQTTLLLVALGKIHLSLIDTALSRRTQRRLRNSLRRGSND